MAFPSDNSYIIFKAKSGSWSEKVFTPAKGQIISFDASIDPSLLTPGAISTTTTGVTIAGGADSTLHNVSIDIATADSTHTGLLSSTNWSTFNSKYGGLPSQTGNNGKFLTTNGTSESWGILPSQVAGSNTEIQFNNSGAFGASSRFSIDDSVSGISTLNINSFKVLVDITTAASPNLIASSVLPTGVTTAYNNTAFGMKTLSALTTGDNNCVIGMEAGDAISTGRNNTCIGTYSGTTIGTGLSNTLLGYQSGTSLTGDYNTLLGTDAAAFMTTGDENTLVGTSTFIYKNGNCNVGLGIYAGNANTPTKTSTNSVNIGAYSGYGKYGTGSIYIGYSAGFTGTDTSESDKLYIANGDTTSPLIYGVFNNTTPANQSLTINGKLESVEVFKQKTFNQASEPTTTNIPDGYSAFWTDTDDSKCYLCYNHGGTIKKVELT